MKKKREKSAFNDFMLPYLLVHEFIFYDFHFFVASVGFILFQLAFVFPEQEKKVKNI